MFEVGFFGEMAMLKNLISISALTVSLLVFGTGRPGMLQQDHAVIGGAIPECNVSYYNTIACGGGIGCPEDFRDYNYTYWGAEDLVVIATEVCHGKRDNAGNRCAGNGQNDTVSGYCTEFFWDWVLP